MDKVIPALQMYDRTPDFNTKHKNGFNPQRYVSIQDRVNNDPEYEVEYINKLIEEGWVRLENIRSILREEMKGRHFKYRLNGKGLSGVDKGTFRSGGIVVGRKSLDDDYVMYKAYNGCLFPLQMADVYEIYMKNPNKKIEGNRQKKIISTKVFFKEPGQITNHPVYLKSPYTGEDVLVYYAKDNSRKIAFMSTKKFEYATRTNDWGFL